MDETVRKYLSVIGRRGGQKSRRVLTKDTARQMVRLREARKAFSKYRTSCFWSCDPHFQITGKDLPWIADQLRKHGDRQAWEAASKICP